MSLLSRLRNKQSGSRATSIPATSATQPKGEAASVARIATVAVANQPEAKPAKPSTVDVAGTVMRPFDPLRRQSPPMSADEEAAIRAWLALIEETDAATIAEVIDRCRSDTEARAYFNGRAAAELPKPDYFPDGLRACRQCSNLTYGGVCSVASPGGTVSAIRGYRPVADIPQRCEAFNEK